MQVRPQAIDDRHVFGDGAKLDLPGGRAETALVIQVARAGAEPCGVVGVALVFDGAVVIGRAYAGGLPAGACARLWIDDELVEIAPVTIDVAAAIAAAGERVKPGDLLLAGSLMQVPVPAGSAVAAEIDGIGRVEAASRTRPGWRRPASRAC
jgi:hypothetical protein